MPRILAVTNQKSGVGSTTTAVNLGAALALAGQPTLVVDLDREGHASRMLGYGRDTPGIGVAEALLGKDPLSRAIVPTAYDGLDLAPSTPNMEGVDTELERTNNPEHRLQFALAELGRPYAWVLVDCPPGVGVLATNALVAADGVLIPLQAEYHALEGLAAMIEQITATRGFLNRRLVREGVVLNMHDQRNNLCLDVEAQLRGLLGRSVLDTVIPRSVRIAEGPANGRTIFAHEPGGKAATAFSALADELRKRASFHKKVA